jgi:sarcosine/dimethylglycine N-methyltransferase
VSIGPVQTARDYYNSSDADHFYSIVWGGEDIHIGLYDRGDEPIIEASRKTVERMARSIEGLSASSRVLDIGSGYCGAARYLARTYGCQVVALNLSEVENQRARALNQREGLSDKITVLDGSFEDIPAEDASFDVVWSQDAILHSGNRAKVLAEVSRVLKPGGQFVFTDPMQADDCPEGVLQPILDRIHLSSLGSPEFYRQTAAQLPFSEESFTDLTAQLTMHYSRILQETSARHQELLGRIDADYLERMKKGLRHWIDGGERGYLAWGIFRFRK